MTVTPAVTGTKKTEAKMRKTVAIYGVALVVALVGAYLSWTGDSDDESESDRGVTIVAADRDELESVTYEEESLEVTLEPREDEAGTYVWARTERTKRAAPKRPASSKPHANHGDAGHAGHAGHDSDAGDVDDAGHAVDEPVEEPEATTEKLAFKTDSDGEKVIDSLAPFRALRKLEGTSEDRYESYGLDDPRGTLTVNYSGGKTRSFEVGGEGYGHRNVYLRDTSDGAIYLVEANTVRPLRHADTRMAEKRPFEWSTNKIEKLVVADGGERVAAVQKNRDDRARSMWVPEGAEVRNVPLETWVQKFLRVRGSGFAGTDEAKGAEKALSVKVFPEDGDPVTVDLLRGASPDGEPRWYVQSGFTRGVMKIPTPLGADLASDFPTVVEALQAEAAEGSNPAEE